MIYRSYLNDILIKRIYTHISLSRLQVREAETFPNGGCSLYWVLPEQYICLSYHELPVKANQKQLKKEHIKTVQTKHINTLQIYLDCNNIQAKKHINIRFETHSKHNIL